MADTNVKIKLSADGKQVRDEIRLIDKDIQELGGGLSNKNKGTTAKTSKSDESPESKRQDGSAKIKQETRDRVDRQMLNELTLLRKELQKLNSNSSAQGQGQTQSNTPQSSTPQQSPNNDSGGSLPSGNRNKDNNILGKLGGVVGKLASATLALKAVSSAWNYASSGAKSSATGESLAHETYGSTLAYSDYYTAKKDAKILGSPYGYDYDTVMNTGNTFMSRAGFTDIEKYNLDMNSILSTSKAWGINTSSLADTSGWMSSIGVVDSGGQKKFADLLAESIVEAEMVGREDEQLQVLRDISETLANGASTVTNESLISSLNLYNALVAQNENLKGSRGSQIVTSMQDLATSGNSSLDILAGFGTQYTGISGKLELRKLAETDPEQYWKQVYEGYTQRFGEGNMTNFTYFLSKQLGSVTKAEDVVSSLGEVSQGTYDINDTTKGRLATQERNANYSGADVSTQETYDIEKEDTQETVGEGLNNVLNPFRDWYSGLGDGGKIAVDGAIGAGKIALTAGGLKLGGKALTSILGKAGISGAAKAGAGAAAKAGAGAGLGISAGTAATAAGVLLAVPLLTSGGNYKHLTEEGRKSDANDWMDRWSAEMGADNTSLDDKWESVKYTSGVHYGNYTKEDLEKRYTARQEMMNFYNSAEGMTYFQNKVQEQYNSGGTITEDFLNGLLSWTSDNGVTYTGSQSDIEEILKNMYGDVYDKDFSRDWTWVGRWNDSAADRFLKGHINDFDINSANTNGLQYSNDSLIVGSTEDNTKAIQDNTSALKQFKESVPYGPYLSDTHTSKVQDYITHNTNVLKQFRESVPYGPYLSDNHISEVQDFITPNSNSLLDEGFNLKNFSLNEDKTTRQMPSDFDMFSGNDDMFMDTLNKIKASEDKFDENTKAIQDNTSIIKQLNEFRPHTSDVENLDSNSTSINTLMSRSKFIGPIIPSLSLFKSHAVGNDYVPYDNYLASLHKGEMVLDKFDAEQYRQKSTGEQQSSTPGKVDLNINVSGSIDGMTIHNQNQIVQAVVTQISKSGLQGLLSNGFVRIQNY